MKTNNSQQKTDANVFSFWKAQLPTWKVTVIRTSLERFGYKLVLPYLSLYIILMGATKTQLGLITSCGLIVAGLLGPFLGSHIDRYGPKKMYMIGIGILIGGYISFLGAHIWQVAALGMFLHQIGVTLSGQSCANICGNCLANCDRAKGMLVCETFAAGALGMLAPMVSGWVLVNMLNVTGTPTNPEQIRPLFAITLFITIISLFVVIFKLDVKSWGTKSKSKSNVLKDGLTILKNDKNCRKWIFTSAVGKLPMAMIIPYLQLYAAEVRHANAATLAAMTTATALTSLCCGFFFGVLGDRIGRKKTISLTISLYIIGLILLITTKSDFMLIIVGILAGFQEIGMSLSGSMQHELVPAKVRGRWSGVNSFTGSMISALVAAVAGFVYDGIGAQWVFIIYIICEIVIRLPLLWSLPETLTYQVDESHFAQLNK